MGRGFLTGQAAQLGTGEKDYRLNSPRFSGDALANNLELVDRLGELASAKGVSVAQLAIAWVMAQGEDIVPIPGTKRRRWLAENIAAADIELTPEEVAAVSDAVPRDAVSGDRYPASSMGALNG
jgi:aryl-alcohol dehydrogenase-like predicted oxidoreductase